MLISKTVKTKPVKGSFTHYKKLGYNIKYREEIEVPISHLPIGSTVKVDVKCEGGCDKIYSIEYRSYLYSIEHGFLHEYCCKKCSCKISFNEVNNPIFKNGCIEKKEVSRKKTCLEKYGFDNALQNPETQNKIRNSRLQKYGTIIIGNIPGVQDKIRSSKELNGSIIPLNLKSSWEIYCLDCHRYTKRVKSDLYKNWNGVDAKDGEYIRENLRLHYNHKDYPTVDHIIPKIYGFLNNIPAIEICKIENLCITKRTLNCSKKGQNGVEFREKQKSH